MFSLTRKGIPCSTIILGDRATWLEKHAAEELQKYVEKISGAVLRITDESHAASVTGNRILIGLTSGCNLIRVFGTQYPSLLPEESSTDNDCIVYAVRGNMLVLSGSNSRSVYYSVCHLLQTEFDVGFYWDQDVFVARKTLELTENLTLTERSAFRMRHSIGQWVYNHGAFLNAAERRVELDRLARNKVNSYRLYNWNSYARKKTFLALGLTGFTITEEDIARRDCVRETIAYAKKLGIDVMVPLIADETTQEFMQLYPNARYFGCEWVKDDNAAPQTVPCLYPDDPMYKTFIQTFARIWIETYGPVRNFVCAPPSEHHISTDTEDFIEFNINFPKYTYEALCEVVPDVHLFYDGWGVRANTPPNIWTMPGVMERFADTLPEEVCFLDLWPDREEFGSNFSEPMYRDAVYGPLRKTKYVLEILNEFGGDDHMHGNFSRIIAAAKEMTHTEVVQQSVGFGNCTELCGVSLHFFDLVFQLGWNPNAITPESFLKDTARRRYGNLSQETGRRAIYDLWQAVYSSRKSAHGRYQKRCYLARPQRSPAPVSESLEITAFLEDFMTVMTALPDEQKTDAIGQDMYDVMRQYISEYFNLHLCSLMGLFLHRKHAEHLHGEFETHAAILEQLLVQLEHMTRENPKMYIETIVRQLQGRPCDPDISGADCPAPLDFRAWMRDMGTTFVRSIPNLPDYDSQDYHELISCYYHPRMLACMDTLRGFLDDEGKTPPQTVDAVLEQRYKAVEDHWIDAGYPVTDAYKKPHLPLWQAAQNAWQALRGLSLKKGLADYDGYAVKQAADIFAGFSHDSEPKEERSWVSENPFASCTHK